MDGIPSVPNGEEQRPLDANQESRAKSDARWWLEPIAERKEEKNCVKTRGEDGRVAKERRRANLIVIVSAKQMYMYNNNRNGLRIAVALKIVWSSGLCSK